MSGSWQSYTDQFIASGLYSMAAIAGKDGTVWVTSGPVNTAQKEIAALITCLDAGQSTSPLFFSGLSFAPLYCDESLLSGSTGSQAIQVQPSQQVVVIGVTVKGHSSPDGINGVSGSVTYLQNSGY